MEIGFGEGFYLWELARQAPGIFLKGYDISPSARAFTERLLRSSGCIDYDLRLGNIFEGLPVDSASQDWGILAEVIEHIPRPEEGIAEMARMIKSGGHLYITTVIDSNHMDHIVNFESPAAVENLLAEAGFAVLDSVVYRIQDDFPGSPDKSVGLAFVCERA